MMNAEEYVVERLLEKEAELAELTEKYERQRKALTEAHEILGRITDRIEIDHASDGYRSISLYVSERVDTAEFNAMCLDLCLEENGKPII